MPEDVAAPEEDTQQTPEAAPEGTPAPEPEDKGSPAPDPYQQRYENLQPEYTRVSQRAAELERFVGYLQDPQTQAQALKALGLELEGDEPDDEPDPDSQLLDRLSGVEQFLQERVANERHEQVEALEEQYLAQEFNRITQANNVKLSEEEKAVVMDLADRYRDDDDLPDMEAAYAAFDKAVGAGTARYRQSKRAAAPGVGQAGIESIDMNDDDARVEHMAQIIQAELDADN